MRIFLITGLGEDPFIFDKLREGLPGTQQVLSLWDLLPDQRVRGLCVDRFAKKVADRYAITASDIIVGHSTGGWLGLYIKKVTGCQLVQVSSWTDGHKVITPVRSPGLIYFAARTGLYLNRFILRRAVKTFYTGKPSEAVFQSVFLRLIRGRRANVVNQLRLIFNPAVPAGVQPDLRIHARADRVVRPPDEPFVEVPGDHFSLYTFPDAVRAPLLELLKSNDGTA